MGLRLSGLLVAIVFLFSAEMFAELNGRRGRPERLPPLKTVLYVPPPPLPNLDLSLPGTALTTDSGPPGGIGGISENPWGGQYSIGTNGGVPPIGFWMRFGGNGVDVTGRADYWFPPGAASEYALAYNLNPPGSSYHPLEPPGGYFHNPLVSGPSGGGHPPVEPSIPEPGSLLLLGIAGLMLVRRPERQVG